MISRMILTLHFRILSPELNSFPLLCLWHHLSPNYPVFHLYGHWFIFFFKSCVSFIGSVWFFPQNVFGMCFLSVSALILIKDLVSFCSLQGPVPLPSASQATGLQSWWTSSSPSPRFLHVWVALCSVKRSSTHYLHGKLPIFPQFQWSLFREDFPD